MTLTTSAYLPRFSDPGDIDEFVDTLGRFERGELSAEDFRRYRLTRGVYGQRQTDVQMIRVKIPQGVLAPAALRALGDVAERFGHGHGSVTTRQNVQFHFVQRADAEAAMRRLDEAGLTTREACGNTVRTVTADPLAGVRDHGTFDVTPYGEAITRFFLRSPWANSLPRKFKIALGYEPGDTAMAGIHDIGLIARVRDGRRGFLMRVAGGLSTSPQAAVVFDEFLPEARLLDACEAVNRVFDRSGNRDNKHRARLKYVLRRMGQERFLEVLREEYAAVVARGGTPLDLSVATPPPAPPAPAVTDDAPATRGPGYLLWRASNTVAQDQAGYHAVFARLPLGAVTAAQFRALASLVTEFADGSLDEAEALIAADGQRSIIRERLFGPGAPEFTGYVAWRALSPMERVPVKLEPRSGIFIGPGHNLNCYPVQKGRTLNLVAFAERNAWAEEGWSIRSSVEELYAEFQHWNEDVRRIIQSIPEGALYKWGLFDREPLPNWSLDHVTLLGDAAHPVLPFLGHGAVIAIEDGVVLARAFAAAANVPEALARYEKARHERASFVFNESRRAVRKFHAGDPGKFTQAVDNKPVDEGLGLFAYDPSRIAV